MDDDKQLERLVQTILESAKFTASQQRTKLFRYLWANRDVSVAPIELWDDLLRDLSRSKAKDEPDYDFEASVRQSCLDLRKAVREFFANTIEGWHIELPPALPGAGYRLKATKLNDPESECTKFWKAHLHQSREIVIVYTEQLFYQDWPKHFIFRYYHLNAEVDSTALSELAKYHPDAFKAGLVAAYPYVASGEIEGRDLILNWFAEHALTRVEKAVVRFMNDKSDSSKSLILFRSATTNKIVREILTLPRFDFLGFSLQERIENDNARRFGRVIVKDATDDEMRRLAPYHPRFSGSNCIIDYNPEEGTVLAILTRIPSPYVDTAVTIFNADFGRAVEQMADLFTNEEQLRKLMEQLRWKTFPMSFEILFGFSIGSIATAHRHTVAEPLAWRAYPH